VNQEVFIRSPQLFTPATSSSVRLAMAATSTHGTFVFHAWPGWRGGVCGDGGGSSGGSGGADGGGRGQAHAGRAPLCGFEVV